MIPVGITSRLLPPNRYGERRFALDERWPRFLETCGFAAVPLPNDPMLALLVAEAVGVAGVLLSGGEDLAPYGGDSPQRDATEMHLLRWAAERDVPALGVCRGLQLIVHACGGTLVRVSGHAGTRHETSGPEGGRIVNSYHHWAPVDVPDDLVAMAWCGPVVEVVRHRRRRLTGIMWHPEREDPPDPADVALVRDALGVGTCAA